MVLGGYDEQAAVNIPVFWRFSERVHKKKQ